MAHKPVIFYNSRGEEISNDPIWKAQRVLGIQAETTSDDEEIDTDPYSALNGTELKALAAERGVDIKGLTKVGQVRDALRRADEAAQDEPTDDETSEDEDED